MSRRKDQENSREVKSPAKIKAVKKVILTATMLVTGAAFTLAGNTSEVSAASIPSAPAKVSLVSVKRTGDKMVVIKWKKAKGASGYRVYRKTGSGKYVRLKTIKGGNKLKFSDAKASPGKTYRYAVRAYKSYKTRIYYNKRTKKWQNSRPLLAKNRGPVKVVTKTRFGKLSNVKQIKVAKVTAPKTPKSGSGSTAGTSSPAGGSSAADTPSPSGGSSGSSGDQSQAGSGGNNTDSRPVTSMDAYLCFYGSMHPGEDAKNPTKDIDYDVYNYSCLCENSYFVLQSYLYPNYGENTRKPVTWTVKENSIGATTEVKGRNLIIKTPAYTSIEQYNGKLVVTMSAEGLTKDKEFTPFIRDFKIDYEDLVNGGITGEIRRGLLWPTLDSSVYNSEIKATVESVTRGCTTDRQKVGRIIEWVNGNIEYNSEGLVQSVHRTWENKGAVCGGISRLIAQMLRFADIPAGQYITIPEINHACTVFWMDGQWYTTDGTYYTKDRKIYGSPERYMAPVSGGLSCMSNGSSQRLGFNIVGGYLRSK